MLVILSRDVGWCWLLMLMILACDVPNN